MTMGLISLTTDFGTRDEYVGVMKAVIWGIAPRVRIVDLSHQVAPQDIQGAAFLLKAAYPYFEAGSVHLGVVDPGVGSGRRIVAMRFRGHFFILPDNGLGSLILDGQPPEDLVCLDNPEFFLPRVSGTFHGRDIFAPVAAHLASGTALGALGPALKPEALCPVNLPAPARSGEGTITGTIVQVDRFGNLTTNIDRRLLERAGAPWDDFPVETPDRIRIRIGTRVVAGLATCYADVPAGEPVALLGSRGLLEIAVNQGDAQRYFGVCRGDAVRLTW
jgi:S-adenosylmethionine hydrolase